MSNFFYVRLAITNIRKNARTYLPYVLTCIGTIAMFYNMCYLVLVKNIGYLSDSASLRQILRLGSIIIGIFAVIFLFYTNSFLIKRRKKEFGLFNILGMEKRHVARIMAIETLFVAIISFVVGILIGILFSKLMLMLLLKIISAEIVFGFEIPAGAILSTLLLFGAIFLINLIYNICQVHLAKPVELLRGGRVGEKEPRTKWLLALIGAISLGTGYYLAQTTESPLAALNIFFVAVMLVMVGTYCLFTAGSIAVLKMLRRNKKYYYQARHFIPVSGMIYRMKQNAVGLANICILSSAVIVVLSTTVSLYVGVEEVMRNRYPKNILISASDVSDKQAAELDEIIAEQTALYNVTPQNVVRQRYNYFLSNQEGARFTGNFDNSLAVNSAAIIIFFTSDDYSKLVSKSVTLAPGEVLLYTLRGHIPGDTIDLNGYKLRIKERLDSFDVVGKMSALLTSSYFFVVDSRQTITEVYRALYGENEAMAERSYYCGFDTTADPEVQISLTNALSKAVKEMQLSGYAEGAEKERAVFYSLYGGLFYIGLFLGLLFIMGTVLIIYYKQIAEGYDDKERYDIMQKVGMSHEEVRRVIRSQVLAVFFLPLVTAAIHIAFAFKVITKLLIVFNLTNVPLFALCTVLTILVFAILYIAVYALTAKSYYRIVS